MCPIILAEPGEKPMDFPNFPRVRLAGWGQDGATIHAVRNTVFTGEQGIAESLDFDGRDAQCVHVRLRQDTMIDRVGPSLPAARHRRVAATLARPR